MKTSKAPLWGRKKEYKNLMRLKEKSTSSFIVVMGRRRIGKSYLLRKFSEEFPKAFLDLNLQIGRMH